MINCSSKYQSQSVGISNLYHLELAPACHRAQLGTLLPWDRMVDVYKQNISITTGAGTINRHRIIGTFIIKHKLLLSQIRAKLHQTFEIRIAATLFLLNPSIQRQM